MQRKRHLAAFLATALCALVIPVLAALGAAFITPAAAQAASTSFEGESMATVPSSASQVTPEVAASGGYNLAILSNSTSSKAVTLVASTSLTVRARGKLCNGDPHMLVQVDGVTKLDTTVPYSALTDITTAVSIPGGSHTVSVVFDNDNYQPSPYCSRDIYLDKITFTGPDRAAFDTTAPGTVGSTDPNFPRSLSYCSSRILLNASEPTSRGNAPYLNAGDSYATMGWGDGDSRFSWWSSFPRWLTRRGQIDGHYSNGVTDYGLTTPESFSVAACRWGVREDLLRAVAVQESDWKETALGDVCGPVGQASYGITQVKNLNCSNSGDWGGYPRTANSVPFNLDTYGAAFRACLEQAFWSTIPAGDDAARREKGCVGQWFSGSYNPDISYTTSVYGHLAARDWLAY